MNNWKNKTCKNCIYRIEKICRKNPPVIGGGIYYRTLYPTVRENTHCIRGAKYTYKEACSYYKRRENNETKS